MRSLRGAFIVRLLEQGLDQEEIRQRAGLDHVASLRPYLKLLEGRHASWSPLRSSTIAVAVGGVMRLATCEA